MQVLQDIATSSHSVPIDSVNKDGEVAEFKAGIYPNVSLGLDVFHETPFTHSYLQILPEAENSVETFSGSDQPLCNLLTTDQQPLSCPTLRLPLNPEGPHDNKAIGHLLQQEGIIDERTKLQLMEKNMSLQTILEAGLKALSQQDPSEEAVSPVPHDTEERTSNGAKLLTDKLLVLKNAGTEYTAPAEYSTPLPDIRKNHIRIKQVMFASACFANALSIGFPVSACSSDDNVSPFFRHSISELAAKTASLSEFTNLSIYLRPTATQMMHKHHPYIDMLPFPTFRERIIKLAYVEEPIIDEGDLCQDLLNDGLVCWGSSLGGGSVATGSGAPWDIRSWEAQPWFLRKWWILIGGAEGEIYKQTQWWCEMRGERSCYPW
jgi:hypothetical protein